MTDRDAPEVVVVGAGSSGAVVAARLAAAGVRVLLIDAGPAPRSSAELTDPDRPPGPDSPWARWTTASLPHGRQLPIVRGRVVGGSSAVNGAYFVRPRPADVASWTDDPRWGRAATLATMIRLEDDPEFADDTLHGTGGPVPIHRTPVDQLHPSSAAFLERCAASGWPVLGDLNGAVDTGVGRVPRNVRHGVRVSVAGSHLAPVADLGTLAVRTLCTATRVLAEGSGVTGVEVVGPDGPEVVATDRVVLAAGAIGSAELLLRSGIGPAAELEPLGLVVHRDAAVGAHCSEHPVVELLRRRAPALRDGPLVDTALHLEVRGRVVEVMPTCAPYGRLTGHDPADDLLAVRVSLMQPRSRGRVRLVSTDPAVPAAVELGHLSDPEDRADMREAVRVVSELLAPGGVAHDPSTTAQWLGPAAAVLAEDAATDRWIEDHLGTSMHLCGTAPMGAEEDPDAVVRPDGSVIGVRGLSVVDTSIVPTVPSRGPAATAVLLGEHLSAMMLR